MAERGQALWRFEMRDANRPDVTLGSELQLTVIELKKADRLGQLQGPARDWVRFFEHWQEETVMGDVTHEPVRKAMGSIRKLSADEEAQRLAEAREWGRINWNLSIGAARREGLKQGLKQGLERGLERGRIEALRNALAQLLEQRFGPLPEWAATQLAAAEGDQLGLWTERILSVGSLEELFARSG